MTSYLSRGRCCDFLPEQEKVLQWRLSVSLPSHRVTLAREQVRVRDCWPSPHVWLHALHRDQGCQPASQAVRVEEDEINVPIALSAFRDKQSVLYTSKSICIV